VHLFSAQSKYFQQHNRVHSSLSYIHALHVCWKQLKNEAKAVLLFIHSFTASVVQLMFIFMILLNVVYVVLVKYWGKMQKGAIIKTSHINTASI
jgi:uncharacterized membrane protein YagU involved in acid resistance